MTLDPAVLARIPLLAALDPATVRVRPMNGHTNTMLALDTPIGGFALRLPRAGASARVDREAERTVLRLAAGEGITPWPLFFDTRDGTMLSRMEPDRTTRPPSALHRNEAGAAALGRLLRKLHDSPFQFPWTFVAADVVTAHFERVDEPALCLRLLGLAHHLDDTVGRRVPCHDDVHAGNVLWQGRRAWLIDWEYAGMNDPAFDLATAQIELVLDEAGFAALLEGWSRDDASWRMRIAKQAALAHGIAGAWYLAQGRGTGDPAMASLGERRLQGCLETLSQVGF